MKFFEVETLFVLLTTSFDRQFQDWSCPAKYTYKSLLGAIFKNRGLRIESEHKIQGQPGVVCGG
jgi:hypothetical protein